MGNQKYSILYSGDSHLDIVNLFTYMEGFAKGLGFDNLDIDTQACQSILINMRHDFPHNDGVLNASPFKKIANFVTYFVALRPVKSEFPDTFAVYGHKLNEIRNHQNAIFAYHIAVDSLRNAAIYRNKKEILILENKIQVSQHSYLDIIDGLSNVTPVDHFKLVTLLFEQLAYRFNPNASYATDIF